ncbi:MAG: hypothetical protein ACFFGZ_15690 [Candidatus Thorarchaeota archaeon]
MVQTNVGRIPVDDANPSPLHFSLQLENSQVLTEKWLEDALKGAGWRYRLLVGVLQFAVPNITSIQSLGPDYLIQLARPADKSELRVFLDIIRRLSFTRPLLKPESSQKDRYILLHQL